MLKFPVFLSFFFSHLVLNATYEITVLQGRCGGIHTLSYPRPTNPVFIKSRVRSGPTWSTFPWPELLRPCWGFSATWALLSPPARSWCGQTSADPLWPVLRGLFPFSNVVVPSAELICLFVIPPSLVHDRQKQSHEVSFPLISIHFSKSLEICGLFVPWKQAGDTQLSFQGRSQVGFRELNATGKVSEIHWSIRRVLAQYPGCLYWPV